MRKLRFLFWTCVFWSLPCLALSQVRVADVPNPRRTHGGWITDSAQQLGEVGPELEKLLSALNNDTGAEVALAILPSIGDANPREFATELFKLWAIGRRGHDDGLLVLHVLDQRRVEIETGYGMEAVLTDVECAWLINDVLIPFLRAGKIAEGHAALLRGIDYGVRNSEATREQLIAATGADTTAGVPAADGDQGGAASERPFGNYLEEIGPGLLFAMLLAGFAAILRKLAHRSLYRNPKRRPGEFSGCLVAVLSVCGVAFLVAAWLTERAWVAWCSVACLGAFAVYLCVSAVHAFKEGRRRYAPRTCQACGAKLRLLDDDKDDRYLDEGQRAEEGVRSADYFVWRCQCGALEIERYHDEGDASTCHGCGYQTLQLKKTRELRPATTRSSGLAERHYVCAHCKVQKVEQIELPKLEGSTSVGGSSRSSSSRSSSSGRSSFGGGSSGGGGAGGSY